MRYRPQKIACALDVGQSSVKLLKMQRGGGIVHARYDLAQEGFLDASELYGESGIIKWLRELKLDKLPIAIAIPQYLCTTKVLNDYPKNTKDDALQTLIDVETRNLAGLSDESFISDYQKMDAVGGVEMPVLAAFTRQIVPEQELTQLENIGVTMANATMGGLAIANALFELHPDVLKASEPQVILDIGKESSTCVVTFGGNILNTSSLMAGADNCANGIDQLFNELNNVLDNWRNSEPLPEVKEARIAKIWLCGGGALKNDLAYELGRRFNCGTEVFGPVFEDGKVEPEFAVAYGLALQELGEAKYAISLAPEDVRWRRCREDRFSILAVACALFFVFAFAMLGYFNYTMDVECSEMHLKIDSLRKCEDIIPKLDGAIDELEHQQRLLSPLVELGSRSKVYMRALEELSSSLNKDDWCIYFSDQYSHKDYAEQKVELKEAPSRQKRRGNAGIFDVPVQEEKTNPDQRSRINLDALPQLEYLVVGGYTLPGQDKTKDSDKYKGRYGAVLKIQEKLMHKDSAEGGSKAESMFTNVDWLNENKEWTGREAQVSMPWNAYLKNNKNYFPEYTEFKLKLMLARRSVDMGEVKK